MSYTAASDELGDMGGQFRAELDPHIFDKCVVTIQPYSQNH